MLDFKTPSLYIYDFIKILGSVLSFTKIIRNFTSHLIQPVHMLWAVVDIEIFKVPGRGGYRFNRSYTLIPMELILMKQTNEYSRKIT